MHSTRRVVDPQHPACSVAARTPPAQSWKCTPPAEWRTIFFLLSAYSVFDMLFGLHATRTVVDRSTQPATVAARTPPARSWNCTLPAKWRTIFCLMVVLLLSSLCLLVCLLCVCLFVCVFCLFVRGCTPPAQSWTSALSWLRWLRSTQPASVAAHTPPVQSRNRTLLVHDGQECLILPFCLCFM
jgi:hypothetical protein